MITAEHNIFNQDDGQIEHNVTRIVRHPQYNVNSLSNDFAILEVYPEIDFRNSMAKPVCLPNQDVEGQFSSETTMFTVSGWGLRKDQWSKHKMLHLH